MVNRLRSHFRLLIADDDPGVRDALGMVFETRFELVVAECGEEAVEIIERTRVDIALLDLHMGRRTGLETLLVLKRVHNAAPGILLTSDATEPVRKAAAEAQAFTVLAKPVRKAELVATVETALRIAYPNAE